MIVLAFIIGAAAFACFPTKEERDAWQATRRDRIARHTPEGLPNVWHDLDTAEKEQ